MHFLYDRETYGKFPEPHSLRLPSADQGKWNYSIHVVPNFSLFELPNPRASKSMACQRP